MSLTPFRPRHREALPRFRPLSIRGLKAGERGFSSALLLAGALALVACSDNTGPGSQSSAEFTVNAAAAFAYLKLGAPADTVTVADPSASTAWDLGFFATTVSLNGGAAGPGGVRGFCVCEHASATTTELQAFSADPTKQQAVFDSVTVADIPADASFVSDLLEPVIRGWYTGAYGSGTLTANRVWVVRVGTGPSAVLGKVHILELQGATATTPGKLKFQFAIEPAAGQPFAADVTDSVDLTGSGPVYYKFTTAGAGTSSDWEAKFDHWDIHLNGGVSGPGAVAGLVDSADAYASITYAMVAPIPPQAFQVDAFSGVFGTKPWYRYNITGADNQIWPTFSTYLIKRGATVFKVQLVGYYATNGSPRHITVRYARLQG